MATSGTTTVLRDALSGIKPASDELEEAERFAAELNERLKAKRIRAVAMVGGSGAKATHLKGDHDIDLFVRFDYKAYKGRNEELSDLLAKALPKGAERIHGSRDYFQLRRGEYLFEIVPVLNVTRPEQALNVMDVSPLHVSYVAKRIRANPLLADEIRLAKQFCKAAKVYGAESYINGFSGHVLDLLVLQYGSFLRLLQAATKWEGVVVLDPAKHHRNPLFTLNASKRLGPLILVDPIQPERNAAAALSRQAFDRFREAARAFLRRPSLQYFTITPLTPLIIKNKYTVVKDNYKTVKDNYKKGNYKKNNHKRAYERKGRTVLFVLEGTPLEGKDDVVATKLLKAHERIVEEGARNGFSLLGNGWEWDKRRRVSVGYLIFKDETLSPTLLRQGPPLGMKRDCERFRTEHRNAKPKAGRLVAAVPRKYRTPRQFIERMLKDSYVKERAKRMRLV
jgi:tRNA nucleotidyltransferase (CCA-adding enzyme)